MSKMFYLKGVRCNYPSLDMPKGTPEKPDDLKYRITVYLDKKADAAQVKDLKAYIVEAINENGGWTKEKKKKVENELLVHVNGEMLNKFAKIKDGDAMNRELESEGKLPKTEQAGKWVISLNNSRAPQVVGADGAEILGSMIRSSIPSGSYVNVAVSTWSWSKPQSSGTAIQLQGVQFKKKGDPFGKTECGFEAEEEEIAEDSEAFSE